MTLFVMHALLLGCVVARLDGAENDPQNVGPGTFGGGIIHGDIGFMLDGSFVMTTPRYGYELSINGKTFSFRDYYGHATLSNDYDGMQAYAKSGVLFLVVPLRRDVITLHAVRVIGRGIVFFQSVELGRLIESKDVVNAGDGWYEVAPDLSPADVSIILQSSGQRGKPAQGQTNVDPPHPSPPPTPSPK